MIKFKGNIINELGLPETEIVLIICRTLLIIIVLLAPVIIPGMRLYAFPAYFLITAASIYNFMLCYLYWRLRRIKYQRQFMIGIDMILVTFWIYLSGGKQITLFSLYYLLVVIGAIWFDVFGSLIVACFAGFLTCLITTFINPQNIEVVIREILLSNWPLLIFTALLTGYLAEAYKREHRSFIDSQTKLNEFEQELSLARHIQRAFLPPKIPQIEGLEIGVKLVPARRRVGGDYYDIVPLEDGRLMVCIADVAGMSIPGIVGLPFMLKHAFKAYTALYSRPGTVLSKLNSRIYEDIPPDTDMFVSMVYMVFDSGLTSLVYSNAGHELPIIYKAEVGRFIDLPARGLVLGVEAEQVYQERIVDLEPADMLILFTDGLTDAQNEEGKEFGREGLQAAVKEVIGLACHEMVEHVIKRIEEFESKRRTDDKTLLIVRRLS